MAGMADRIRGCQQAGRKPLGNLPIELPEFEAAKGSTKGESVSVSMLNCERRGCLGGSRDDGSGRGSFASC